MSRLSRFVRAVLIPLAALPILVASAVPVNAASNSTTGSSYIGSPVGPYSMDW